MKNESRTRRDGFGPLGPGGRSAGGKGDRPATKGQAATRLWLTLALLWATPVPGGNSPSAGTVAAIIPRPASVELTGGSFLLGPETVILVPGGEVAK